MEAKHAYFLDKQTKIQNAISRVQKKLNFFSEQSEKMFKNFDKMTEEEKDKARAKNNSLKWNEHHDLEYRLEKRLEENWSNYHDWHFDKYQFNAY